MPPQMLLLLLALGGGAAFWYLNARMGAVAKAATTNAPPGDGFGSGSVPGGGGLFGGWGPGGVPGLGNAGGAGGSGAGGVGFGGVPGVWSGEGTDTGGVGGPNPWGPGYWGPPLPGGTPRVGGTIEPGLTGGVGSPPGLQWNAALGQWGHWTAKDEWGKQSWLPWVGSPPGGTFQGLDV